MTRLAGLLILGTVATESDLVTLEPEAACMDSDSVAFPPSARLCVPGPVITVFRFFT